MKSDLTNYQWPLNQINYESVIPASRSAEDLLIVFHCFLIQNLLRFFLCGKYSMPFKTHTATLINRAKSKEVSWNAQDYHLHNIWVIGDYENVLSNCILLIIHRDKKLLHSYLKCFSKYSVWITISTAFNIFLKFRHSCIFSCF